MDQFKDFQRVQGARGISMVRLNGLLYTMPEQLAELYHLALASGVQVHTHTNGDEAMKMALDTFASACNDFPSVHHRLRFNIVKRLMQTNFAERKI